LEQQPASCWSLTIKAVAGIAVVFVLIWLAGGHEATATLAQVN